jgi:RecA-family ATPase
LGDDSIIISGPEYAKMDRPELFYVMAKMIPKPGIVILAGEPKAGKSFLALQIAKHVAEGSDFMGHRCRASRVVYFMFEAEMVWHERIRNLYRADYNLPPNLYFPHPEFKPNWTNLAEPRTQDWLRRVVREAKPDMVVLDPLREIHSGDEQDSTQMKIVGDALTDIFAGKALFIVHHMKKIASEIDQPDPVVSIRGSSYITGKADAIWLLHKNTLSVVPRFALRFQKSLHQDSRGLWLSSNGHIPEAELPKNVG